MANKKYIDIFVREAEEHLQILRGGLMGLERDGLSTEQLDLLLRSAHTLKGSAKMVDLVELSGVAHRMEDLLKDLQNETRELDADMVDVLLAATDALEALVAQAHSEGAVQVNVDTINQALDEGRLEKSEDRESEEPSYSGVERRKSIRASVEKLDDLVNRMSEFLLVPQVIGERQRQMGALIAGLEKFQAKLRRAENYRLVEELRHEAQTIATAMEQDRFQVSYQADDLYQRTMELRMLPLAAITDDFSVSIRNLARTLNKEVRFDVEGGDVEVDRGMLDAIRPMLLHIFNNAVDHGIEDPDDRVRLGKPKAGSIHLKASYEGSFVQLVITDDGKGIDPDNVREKAVSKNLLSQEAAASLTDEEAIYQVLRPGFSTREFITDVSGRGVGLDVVKANLDQIKGNLRLESQLGHGTTITLRFPLTMAVLNCLLINCNDEIYAVPQHYVKEIVRINEADIMQEMGREVVRIHDVNMPLFSLPEILGGEFSYASEKRLTALVLAFREQSLLCMVGRTQGLQTMLVKDFGTQIKNVLFCTGATVLSDGNPAIIISVPDLFTMVQSQQSTGLREKMTAEREQRLKGRVLVVDDSITTRTMEKNILETNGYQVIIAVSGFDALDKLENNGPFDLMVSDVEMPGMTGFELTRKVREQEDLADMPVIIVTSLASDEHRREGIRSGAQAYIVKGAFDQNVLLETVDALIG